MTVAGGRWRQKWKWRGDGGVNGGRYLLPGSVPRFLLSRNFLIFLVNNDVISNDVMVQGTIT